MDASMLRASVSALDTRVDAAEAGAAALDARVDAVEAAVVALPDPAVIWSKDRPSSQFGTGSDKKWALVGDGVSVVFALTGALPTQATRYVAIVDGIIQVPDVAYTVSAGSITFSEAPSLGAAIYVWTPFYGSA